MNFRKEAQSFTVDFAPILRGGRLTSPSVKSGTHWLDAQR